MVHSESIGTGVSRASSRGNPAKNVGNEAFEPGQENLPVMCSASHVTKMKNASIIFPGQQNQIAAAVPESLKWKGEDA
jgi:hypothetical protein